MRQDEFFIILSFRGNELRGLSHHIIVFFIMILTLFCSKPTVIGNTPEPIDVTAEPIQESLTENRSFTLQRGNKDFTMNIRARYQISARVVSAKFYSRGWESDLSPVDLTLVWGDLADLANDRYISYSQHNRWYFYRYSKNCPISNIYIIKHSSNNHLVPATDNIHRALKTVKTNAMIKIKGYLVDILGKVMGNNVWWNTSITRSDTGNHSCEIIYVEKIQILKKVYL